MRIFVLGHTHTWSARRVTTSLTNCVSMCLNSHPSLDRPRRYRLDPPLFEVLMKL